MSQPTLDGAMPEDDIDPATPCMVCQHGTVTVCQGHDGEFLGNDPNDPAHYTSEPIPEAELLRRPDGTKYPHQPKTRVVSRVAFTGTYPCPNCRPEQFLAWNNGCFKPDHIPCDKCRPAR